MHVIGSIFIIKTMENNHNQINYSWAFGIGILLNVIFIGIELIYGFIANSTALIADAGHNISDVAGLLLAWSAIWLSQRKPTKIFSFFYKKSTILISIFNALLLFVAIAFILEEAIYKFYNPVEVAGKQVLFVAFIGFLINAATALLFIKGQKHDLNIKGAFLHMAADAAVSLGVGVSGIIIMYTGANWVDPIMSFIIVLIIFIGTWKLFAESIRLAMGAVPKSINIDKVKETILNHVHVVEIYNLHVWALSTSENSLSVHIIVNTTNNAQLLKELQEALLNNFGILNSTIQLEEERKGMNS